MSKKSKLETLCGVTYDWGACAHQYVGCPANCKFWGCPGFTPKCYTERGAEIKPIETILDTR